MHGYFFPQAQRPSAFQGPTFLGSSKKLKETKIRFIFSKV